MKVKNNLTILERELLELYETHKITIPDEAFFYIRRAMVNFSVNAIHQDRQKRRKMMVDTLKHLPKFMFVGYYYFFRARLRQWFYNMAVKQANIEVIIQNRKIWIAESTALTYKLVSTKNFRDAKLVKIKGKTISNFKEMDDAAVLTVYPPNQRK